MLVLVIYNKPVLPEGHPEAESEREIVGTAGYVAGRLAQAGYEVRASQLDRDLEALAATLAALQPDCVFNLFEGFADDPASEWRVARILEQSGAAFTGSPSEALRLANGKHLAKQLLREAGLPTPDSWVLQRAAPPASSPPWPVIVKPASRDGSVGIDRQSVVSDRRAMKERVACLLARYGPPVLVEQYVPGREFNVALVETPELRALPPSEILFTGEDRGAWPILTYDAKWEPSSREYAATPPVYPAQIAPELAGVLEELACRAFRLLGCRQYARVDFRVDQGRPYILEVNPNPCFSPGAPLAAALASAGMDHGEFAVELVRDAVARAPFEITNLAEARFECTYGRGCDGVCCREGRPLIYPEEIERLDANLFKFLPLLRPKARDKVEKAGYLSGRRRLGQALLRIVEGWCVFFHHGCVLHRAGVAEGDKFRYKPAVCALFPIQQDDNDRWYVRQRGFRRERWKLFCLDPHSTTVRAADSLRDEIALARRFADEAAAQKNQTPGR